MLQIDNICKHARPCFSRSMTPQSFRKMMAMFDVSGLLILAPGRRRKRAFVETKVVGLAVEEATMERTRGAFLLPLEWIYHEVRYTKLSCSYSRNISLIIQGYRQKLPPSIANRGTRPQLLRLLSMELCQKLCLW